MESDVQTHYNSDHLKQKIADALVKAGKDISRLSIQDLAVIDQLHTGGIMASRALCRKDIFKAGIRVLDAGCGIGGTSRLLAGETGCRVHGIDLAGRFIEAAKFLNQCTGLEDRVSFRQGSVLSLPFKNSTFDVVLCQHMLMNIQDKSTAVKEFHRVLRPGGTLILHEISKGQGDHMVYPVPWAAGPSISFIEPWDKSAERFLESGFKITDYADGSPAACAWWEKVRAASKTGKNRSGPLNPGLIFGKNAVYFGETMAANFRKNAVRLTEAVLKKSE